MGASVKSSARRVAMFVLGALIVSTLAIVLWRFSQPTDWVPPDKRVEFFIFYTRYPLLLVGVESLALALLYGRRLAGRILTAAVFTYAAFYCASLFGTQSAACCPTGTEGTVGRVGASLASAGLALLAVYLVGDSVRETHAAAGK